MSHPTEAKTFDEIEEELNKEGNEPLNQKIEGDDVPEQMKGKTVAEIATDSEKLSEALKVSEQARAKAEEGRGALEAQLTAMKAAQPPQSPPATPPDSDPEMTDEQLKDLYEKDPLAAISTMQDRAMKRIESNLAARIQPLSQGSADMAEQNARQKYEAEFELFGDQIEAHISKLPDRSVLANSRAWDDLVAYVRGQPDNFMKLVARASEQENADKETEARQAAEQSAGASLTSVSQRTSSTKGGSGAEPDPVKKEIADKLGVSYDDYLKWEKM